MESNVIVEAFDALGGDPSEAIAASREFQSTRSWIAWQSGQVAAAGAAATAIPGIHALAIPADLAFLLHKVAYCSWGIGALHRCDIEGKDDLAVVLALWGGAVSDEDLATVVKAAAAGETGAAGAIGIAAAGVAGTGAATLAVANPKLAAKGLGLFGPMVAKKALGVAVPAGTVPAGQWLVTKVAPKLAPKFAAKVSTKGVAGFVPLLGPLVSASVNAYVVGHTGEVAERYYSHKRQFQEALAGRAGKR
jgi:hypothetical protein